jgi:hypothetical protein
LGELTVSGHFITFRPATGIFQKAIQPYKKWYEKSDMSPPIEVEGNLYRILRTTGLVNKVDTRKVVVCNQDGHLIDDEELTRTCFKIQVYLNHFQINTQGIIASSKEDTVTKLDEFIKELKLILENAASHLTDKELEAMRFHLYYYEETRHYAKVVAKEASQLLDYTQALKENRIEMFSVSFINRLEKNITGWEINKRYIEALMIEDGLKARKTVRKVLRNTEYQYYFPNRHIAERMVDETYEAEKAVNRFIHDGKKGWKRETEWLNPDKGEFNLERYLNDLWHRNIVEVFRKVNINEAINNHWVFSPRCIYSR